eukprot:984481-Pyramimonas_sp.AAC.1
MPVLVVVIGNIPCQAKLRLEMKVPCNGCGAGRAARFARAQNGLHDIACPFLIGEWEETSPWFPKR